MKKKMMRTALTAMIAVAAFTGCGKSQEATAVPETTAVETIAETEPQTAEPETEQEAQEPENIVYTDSFPVPLPEEVFNMLDNGAILFGTEEMDDIQLNDRQGKTYIELDIVQVKDIKTGEGTILNSFDEDRNYCCVGDMPEFNLQSGDIVAKYFVYNPLSDAEDDIIDEYSVIVEK